MGRVPAGKKLIVLAVAIGALVAPQAASATITSVFNGDVSCSVQGDGVRFCGSTSPRSTSKAWDGVPIDVNVAFPPEPASGPDGNFPLVMMFHGYGGGKIGLGSMQHWLDKGYATFSMTDRGFHQSCGTAAAKAADPTGCTDGYVRLIDNRYEVRDAQEFAGELADQGVGLVNPQEIASIGGSYGGGMSMALGALKDRMVMPDYSLVPWESPDGKPMQIAAAAPNIPWTDLAYSLAPNGSTLDYVADAPYSGRPGVQKQSLVTGLYISGLASEGFYSTPLADPTADLTTWKTTLDAGEPYGSDVQDILAELTQHHSSYYIDHSQPPAPMLMSSGFTDDLFPADETIRYYNRTKTEYPNADVALFFGDFGHPRAQNKSDVTSALEDRIDDWFDYYVKGQGSAPQQGVEAFTETCPSGAPSGGPYAADNWAKIAPGEIRFNDKGTKTIAAEFNQRRGLQPGHLERLRHDPVGRPPRCRDLQPRSGTGRRIHDARLDLGDRRLHAARRELPGRRPIGRRRPRWHRDARRPRALAPATGGPTRQVFQLHPNGWTFEEGHAPKLELMAADGVTPDGTGLASYGRPSNGQQDVTVSNLEMRMPVVEKPGSLGGLVKARRPRSSCPTATTSRGLRRPAPPGGAPVEQAAPGERQDGRARVKCPKKFDSCHGGKITLRADANDKGGKVDSRSRAPSSAPSTAAELRS